jgi:hypothetical protein
MTLFEGLISGIYVHAACPLLAPVQEAFQSAGDLPSVAMYISVRQSAFSGFYLAFICGFLAYIVPLTELLRQIVGPPLRPPERVAASEKMKLSPL